MWGAQPVSANMPDKQLTRPELQDDDSTLISPEGRALIASYNAAVDRILRSANPSAEDTARLTHAAEILQRWCKRQVATIRSDRNGETDE